MPENKTNIPLAVSLRHLPQRSLPISAASLTVHWWLQ